MSQTFGRNPYQSQWNSFEKKVSGRTQESISEFGVNFERRSNSKPREKLYDLDKRFEDRIVSIMRRFEGLPRLSKNELFSVEDFEQ